MNTYDSAHSFLRLPFVDAMLAGPAASNSTKPSPIPLDKVREQEASCLSPLNISIALILFESAFYPFWDFSAAYRQKGCPNENGQPFDVERMLRLGMRLMRPKIGFCDHRVVK